MKTKRYRWPLVLCVAVLAFVFLPGAGASTASPEISLPPSIAPLYEGGHYDQALEVLKAALEQAPRDASLHYWLGRCFFELRDFSKAISSFRVKPNCPNSTLMALADRAARITSGVLTTSS